MNDTIEKKLKENIFCQNYNCSISKNSCYIRYGQVKYHNKKTQHPFEKCKDCKTGEKNYKKKLSEGKEKNPSPKVKEKTCTECKKTIGLSMFPGNGEGYICLTCLDGEKQAKIEPEVKKLKDELKVVVDFSKNKELLRKMKIKADREFRTLEQQILFDCNALTK